MQGQTTDMEIEYQKQLFMSNVSRNKSTKMYVCLYRDIKLTTTVKLIFIYREEKNIPTKYLRHFLN